MASEDALLLRNMRGASGEASVPLNVPEVEPEAVVEPEDGGSLVDLRSKYQGLSSTESRPMYRGFEVPAGMDLDRVNDWFAAIDVREDAREAREAEPYLTRTPEPWEGQFLEQMKGLSLEASKEEQRFLRDPAGRAEVYKDWAGDVYEDVMAGDPETIRNVADVSSLVDITGASDVTSAVQSGRLAYREPDKRGSHLTDAAISGTAGGIQSIATLFGAAPLVGSLLSGARLKAAMRGADVAEDVSDVAKAVPDAPAPVFESVLEKAVAESMPAKIGVDDVEQFLNKKGAKKSEIVDTKVPEFVAAAKAVGKKSISKDELIKHLDDNKVQIEEVRLGGTPPELKALKKDVDSAYEPVEDMVREFRQKLTDEGFIIENTLHHMAKDNPDKIFGAFETNASGVARQAKMFAIRAGSLADLSPTAQEVLNLLQSGKSDLFRNPMGYNRKQRIADIDEALSIVDAIIADARASGVKPSKVDQRFYTSLKGPEIRNVVGRMKRGASAAEELKNTDAFMDFESAKGNFDLKAREIGVQAPEYEQHTLPGGEDYQEILLTVPAKKPHEKRKLLIKERIDSLQKQIDEMADYEMNILDDWAKSEGRQRFGSWSGIGKVEKSVRDKALKSKKAREGLEAEVSGLLKEKRRYESTMEEGRVVAGPELKDKVFEFRGSHHSHIPNVMAHIRTKTRIDSKGRKILFVEEIQSDWHQKGLKHGYQGQKIELGKAVEDSLQELQSAQKALLDWHKKNPEPPNRDRATLLSIERPLPDLVEAIQASERGEEFVSRWKKSLPKEDQDILDASQAYISKLDELSDLEKEAHAAAKRLQDDTIGSDSPFIIFRHEMDELGNIRFQTNTDGFVSSGDIRKSLEKKRPGRFDEQVPDAPLKDTKEWTALAIKRIFREAADEGYDGVAFTRGEDVARIVGGVEEGQKYFYDKLIPSIAKKETKAKQGTTLIELEDLGFSSIRDPESRHTAEFFDTPAGSASIERLRDSGKIIEVPFFELTDKVRDKVIKPQKLYSLALPGIAVGAAAAEEEELSAAAALGAIGLGGMALYKGMKGARGAGKNVVTSQKVLDKVFLQTEGQPNLRKLNEKIKGESDYYEQASVPLSDIKPMDDMSDVDFRRADESKGPIVIDRDGVIIDGHHRYALALSRGDKTIEALRPLGAPTPAPDATKGARAAAADAPKPPATDVATAGAKTEDEAVEAARLWREMGTESPYFKKKFGNTKVVDDDGEALPVFHGTSGDFDEFRAGTPESAFGSAIYTSSSVDDVNTNYARAEGPDIRNRVDQEIDRIDSLDDFYDDDILDAAQRYMDRTESTDTELLEAIKTGDVEKLKDELEPGLIEQIARQSVLGDEAFSVMKTYVNIENPVYLDPSGTKGRTTFDLEVEYDDDGDFVGESGSVLELLEAIDEVADDLSTYQIGGRGPYSDEVDKLKTFIGENSFDGELDALDLFKEVRGGNYYFESDTGGLENTEFIRKVFEKMGFDGIVADAYHFFGDRRGPMGVRLPAMAGVTPGTYHYMAFKPEQIKSATGNVGTFDPSGNILKGIGVGAAIPAAAAVRSQRTEEEGNPAPDEPMEEAPYEPYYTGDDYVQSYELSDSRQVYDEQIGLQSRFDELTNELGMVEAEYYSLTDAERASKRGDVLHEWYNDRLDELSSVEEQLEPDGYLRFLKGEDYYYETSPYSLDDFDARRAFDVTGSAGPKIAENIELRSAQELHQVGLFQSTVDMGGPMVHMSGRNGAMNRFVYNKAQEFNHPVQTIQLNRPDKLSLMKDIDNVQSLKDAGLISFLLYKELLGDVKLY